VSTRIDATPTARHGNEAPVSGLPDPLVAPDVDLRGLPYMPLDVLRLRDSDLAIHATGDEFRAAVLLWCASWTQIPAASLPDNDESLARFAGVSGGIRVWKRMRQGALRGWVKCSDGRLYHPVVAEKAAEAWEDRQDYRAARDGQVQRKQAEREFRKTAFTALAAAGWPQAWNTPTSRLRELMAENGIPVTPPVTVTGARHEAVTVTAKKGREGKGLIRDAGAQADAGADACAHAPARARICALLDECDIPYRTAANSRDPIIVTAWARDGFTDDQVREAIARAHQARTAQGDTSPIPINYLDSILRRPRHANGSGRRSGGIARSDELGDQFLREHAAAGGEV